MNSLTFDSNDELGFFYSDLNREKAREILQDSSIGTFLIRDSIKDDGKIVLCVKESYNRITNYKITNKVNENQVKKEFFIHGKEDFIFKTIPTMLEFYKRHYLIQSNLIKPVSSKF